jgi:hypothetical protein
MSDPKDSVYEYQRDKDDFNRQQSNRYEDLKEDFKRDQERIARDQAAGWEAVRAGNTFGAVLGIAGPDAAIQFLNMRESIPDASTWTPEEHFEVMRKGALRRILEDRTFPEQFRRDLYDKIATVSFASPDIGQVLDRLCEPLAQQYGGIENIEDIEHFIRLMRYWATGKLSPRPLS